MKKLEKTYRLGKSYYTKSNIINIIQVLTTIASFLMVGLVYIQYLGSEQQRITSQKYQVINNTVQILNGLYTEKFYNSFSIIKNLKTIDTNNVTQVNAYNYLLNAYNLLSIIYDETNNEEIIVRGIIKKAIYPAILKFTNLKIYYENPNPLIDKMIKTMQAN